MSQSAVLSPDRVNVSALARHPAAAPRRHVLSILDLSPQETVYLCRRAIRLKHARTDPQSLRGRTVGVYFKQTSTRTRTGFQVGAGRLGATVAHFGPGDLQTNTGETLEDTARVFAGYLDVLVMGANEPVADMKVFAAHPTLSVINARSLEEHPTQALTDLSTMLEHFGRLEGLDVLYCGEGNESAASLALTLSRIRGARLTVAAPEGHGLEAGVLATARELASRHGAAIEQVHDTDALPRGVDVVYTSRWRETGASGGNPEWRRRFHPFRVSRELMERVGRPQGTVFMHDLPAARGQDVESEVLDGPQSLAWVQAQFKMWSAMAAMEWCGAGVVEDEG
jgi:ornithine carbamoyltransferase